MPEAPSKARAEGPESVPEPVATLNGEDSETAVCDQGTNGLAFGRLNMEFKNPMPIINWKPVCAPMDGGGLEASFDLPKCLQRAPLADEAPREETAGANTDYDANTSS